MPKTSVTRFCSIASCGRIHDSKGYCSLHYQRLKRHGDPRKSLTNKGKSLRARLRMKTHIRPGSDCHWFVAGKHVFGYGRIKNNGKTLAAHRVAWELANGPILDSLHVLHKCDNPACVNPDHLFLGTNQDNIDDMDNKGRRINGANSHLSKLTEAQVIEIRSIAGKFKGREIADMFSISNAQVSKIINRTSWRHVL